VHRCLEAAGLLAAEGVSAAVLDLRTVAPLDRAAVTDLGRRTGRVLVVDEDYTRGGLSGEVAALLAEQRVACAYARVTTEETIPYARHLEAAVLPNVPRILEAARSLS
jgi:pyruvate/2-oxoglutarate/acetoin dehydrogenase E1 component